MAALVAVNAFGDVYHPKHNEIIAGSRKIGGGFADSVNIASSKLGQLVGKRIEGSNTTLAVVATNVKLTKSGATKVAQDGLARTIRPVHTTFDGDTVFAFSYGDKEANVSLISAVAADLVAEAIISAIHAAETLAGIPAARDL